jgi:hypothetical protein
MRKLHKTTSKLSLILTLPLKFKNSQLRILNFQILYSIGFFIKKKKTQNAHFLYKKILQRSCIYNKKDSYLGSFYNGKYEYLGSFFLIIKKRIFREF